MKLSRKWLNEFVELSLEEKNDHDFAEAMTMTGSKVEGTSYMGEGISRVVVGKIVEMVRHHDSDHMWTCQVDVGGERLLQIVTGAQNQKVGDLVPVALGRRQAPRRRGDNTPPSFRGELSEGMMCSLKELGLTLHDLPYAYENGLFVIAGGPCKPGDDIVPVMRPSTTTSWSSRSPRTVRTASPSSAWPARPPSPSDKPLKLHTP
ncbi:MAG: hypothetical protein ACLTSG_13730 [Lachnospiraceae bacterium]